MDVSSTAILFCLAPKDGVWDISDFDHAHRHKVRGEIEKLKSGQEFNSSQMIYTRALTQAGDTQSSNTSHHPETTPSYLSYIYKKSSEHQQQARIDVSMEPVPLLLSSSLRVPLLSVGEDLLAVILLVNWCGSCDRGSSLSSGGGGGGWANKSLKGGWDTGWDGGCGGLNWGTGCYWGRGSR